MTLKELDDEIQDLINAGVPASAEVMGYGSVGRCCTDGIMKADEEDIDSIDYDELNKVVYINFSGQVLN